MITLQMTEDSEHYYGHCEIYVCAYARALVCVCARVCVWFGIIRYVFNFSVILQRIQGTCVVLGQRYKTHCGVV